jgi:hypothetical protein
MFPIVKFSLYPQIFGSRIALWYTVGLWAGKFSRHRVQPGSGAHPAPCLMGTEDYFTGGGAHLKRGQEQLYHLLTNCLNILAKLFWSNKPLGPLSIM